MRHDVPHPIHDERGVTMVTALFFIPAMILFIALVLATGDWWVHKRHLQTQADAAALAAARDMSFPCTDDTRARIESRVTEYGGDLNPQVENSQANVAFAVNKPQYPGQTKSDDTPDESPCDSLMIDVKATESDLRSIMGVGIVPFINARARVEIFQATELSGAIPIAVPEPAPKKVRVFFVDEATGATIPNSSRELVKNGTDGNGNAVWDSAGDTISLNVGSRSRIGVRVALSGQTSTTCGDPLVNCYDYDSSAGTDSATGQKGLVFVHGYAGDGTVSAQTEAPKLRGATLTSSTCPDPYFSVATTCTVALSADLDFGTGNTNPALAASAGGVLATVKATTSKGSYDMHWVSGKTWATDEVVPLAAGAGQIPIDISWDRQVGKLGGTDCKNGNNNPCKGTFSNVQRTESGNDSRSGPIQLVQVTKGGAFGINSLRQCDSGYTTCTYDVGVRLSIKGTLEIAKDKNDPPVDLRIGDQNQTQALDCDPNLSTLADELVQGCGPVYKLNTGTVCPNRSTLWGSPQSWPCVAIATGAKTNAIPAGLNERILGDPKATSCTHPNLYKKDFGVWDSGDPRIVQLLLTPFGSFSGTGNDATVPVTNFASFYVTGWTGSGSGFDNPCETVDIPSDPLIRDEAPGGSGFMVGHFINYVQTLPDGGHIENPVPCDPTVLTTCIAVLTR